jgi:hypothetical protein
MLRPSSSSLLFSAIASAALAFSVTSLASCTSSTPAPATCSAYVVPASTDLKAATSFKTDVLPILVQSCAFTSCHGMAGGTNNGISLGVKPPAMSDPAMVVAGMVNVKAKELPTMNFVTPSDPASSYLMHKVDGDNCTFDKMCSDGTLPYRPGSATCQGTMPQAGDLLPVEKRDTIRRWIAQGAQNN